jgi:ATP-dependent protease ClpP protease subunit
MLKILKANKLASALVAVGIAIALPGTVKIAQEILPGTLGSVTTNPNYIPQDIPPSSDTLSPSSDLKPLPVDKTLTLEKRNTIVLRGVIEESSVAEVEQKLQQISNNLSKDDEIYLVLDSPGGSVFDGIDLINFILALPQKVNTVTLFAASMAFQIAQNLNTRYVTRNGTLMSHRATVSGVGGQLDGEFESRYKMLKRQTDFLDYVAAARMEMPLKDYKNMIIPEYWVFGFDAVQQKAADKEILLRCGKSIQDGTETQTIDLVIAKVELIYSACPLIRTPLSVKIKDPEGTGNNSDASLKFNLKKKEIDTALGVLFTDKVKFVKDYIVNDKYSTIFK